MWINYLFGGKTLWAAALVSLLLPAFPSAIAEEQEADAVPAYRDYAGLLKAHVDGLGRVDYHGLKNNQVKLESFIRELGQLKSKRFESWSEKDRLAFLINAYNALTLKAIIDHYPIQRTTKAYPAASIRQIKGVWDMRAFSLMGEKVSLNHIEHEILRKNYDEPRIHMALVCAARSCPRLRNEPFRGDTLEKQLADQTRDFLKLPERFKLDPRKGRVHLSEIFKWFGGDFIKRYGKTGLFKNRSGTERAVLNFIHRHLEESDAEYLAGGEYEILYLPYDWSLNEQ